MQSSKVSNQSGEPTGESRPPWLVVFGLVLLFSILRRVIENWMPDFLAMGAGALVVGLIAFPMRSIRGSYNFGQWSLRVLLLSLCFSLVAFVLLEGGRALGLF